PGDGFAQGAVALRCVSQAGLEVEAALQAQRDGRRRHEARARGGKLDGQGQAVQLDADFGKGAGVVAAKGEVRAHGARALNKQGDAGVVRERVDVGEAQRFGGAGQ